MRCVPSFVHAAVYVACSHAYAPCANLLPSFVQICIHYYGWAHKWDEWIDVSHGRVAPRETYTAKAAWSRRKHTGKRIL